MAHSPAYYRSLSFWLDSLDDDPLLPRPRLPGTRTPTWPSSAPATPDCRPHNSRSSRPVAAGGRARGRDRRLRRAGAQRRLVLGHVADEPRDHRGPSWPRRRRAHAAGDAGDRGRDREGSREEGINCDFAKGGYLHLARNPAHVARLNAEPAESRGFGLDEDDVRWLDRAETAERLDAAGVPRRALHPALRGDPPRRLARGLAAAVERARRDDPRTDAGHGDRAGPGDDRTARCRPRSSSGRPRATRETPRLRARRWCRCTRS